MKIIVSLLLVFAVLFGFSACGDDTPDSPVSPDGTSANNISTANQAYLLRRIRRISLK